MKILLWIKEFLCNEFLAFSGDYDKGYVEGASNEYERIVNLIKRSSIRPLHKERVLQLIKKD